MEEIGNFQSERMIKRDMLIHFVQPEWSNEYGGLDYDNYHIISALTIEDYERFIKFIDSMKEHECEINGEWYTIDSYIFVLPKDSDCVPYIKVYLYEYIA